MSVMRKLLGRKANRPDPESKEDRQTAPLDPPSDAAPQSASQEVAVEAQSQAQAEEPPPDTRPAEIAADRSKPQITNVAQGHHVGGLCVGYASDVGQLRDHNEDTLITFQGVQLGHEASVPLGFFVIADGMGGHQAGEVASALAARLVTHRVINDVYLPFLLEETPNASRPALTEILRNAVERANDQVHDRVPGGGTTLTCALVMGQRAYIAHVGDSRAYLLIDRDMRRLTQDHSFVNRLIELGELSPEEAAVHPQRHVLYRAVGQGDSLDIDTYQQPLPPGSRLLLCSDGLSGLVPEEQIGIIIASASTPQEACQRLVETANQAGGPDNISVVLIETPLD